MCKAEHSANAADSVCPLVKLHLLVDKEKPHNLCRFNDDQRTVVCVSLPNLGVQKIALLKNFFWCVKVCYLHSYASKRQGLCLRVRSILPSSEINPDTYAYLPQADSWGLFLHQRCTGKMRAGSTASCLCTANKWNKQNNVRGDNMNIKTSWIPFTLDR